MSAQPTDAVRTSATTQSRRTFHRRAYSHSTSLRTPRLRKALATTSADTASASERCNFLGNEWEWPMVGIVRAGKAWEGMMIGIVEGGSRSRMSRSAIEYLDLPQTLPYAITSLRAHLSSYLSELEHRLQKLSPFFSRIEGVDEDELTSSARTASLLAPVYSHLEALKEDLRQLSLLLPSSSTALPFPSPKEAFVARPASLAADWERLSNQFSITLPRPKCLGPTISHDTSESGATSASAIAADHEMDPDLPSLPGLAALRFAPALPDLSKVFASILQPLTKHFPSPTGAGALFEEMQTRLDALKDAMSRLSLSLPFDPSADPVAFQPHALARSWKPTSESRKSLEEKLSSFSAATRRRANSVIHSAEEVAERMMDKAEHALLEAEETLVKAALHVAEGGRKLIGYDDLPNAWKNNECIRHGYRFIPVTSWRTLVLSTFTLHNETGNIHTHLMGIFIIIPLLLYQFLADDAQLGALYTGFDRLTNSIYLVAGIACLAMSVGWHVMSGCAERRWMESCATMDFCGISWLVAASIWTVIYNGFYCQPNLAIIYGITTLLTGIVGSVLPLQAWWNKRVNKFRRICVFLGMCATALAPLAHMSYKHGEQETLNFFRPIIPSLLCYISGLILYAFQFPESVSPGRFDFWGHSHQFWHVAIVLAILAHYRATKVFHNERDAFSCAAVPVVSDGLSDSGDGAFALPFAHFLGSSFLMAVGRWWEACQGIAVGWA